MLHLIEKILSRMGYRQKPISVSRFQNEEDGSFYNVWHIEFPKQSFVLKRAKGEEVAIYRAFFSSACSYAPRLCAAVRVDDADYLLIEYIPGKNLMRCRREDLIRTIDSLIEMQNEHWMTADIVNSYERSLKARQNRRSYLHDQRLEATYDAFLEMFNAVPRTLCHDDFLPFNVLVTDDRAVFIDWEIGGILPYPTSLVRLIAHSEEDENAFFYMKNEDKIFAIDYFYERFVKGKGIDYITYQRTIALFLFYEYCEWIYIGHKWNATDSDRFRKYSKLAGDLAEKLGF